MIRLAALGLSLLAFGSAPNPTLDAALVHGLTRTYSPGGQGAIYQCGRLVWSSPAGVTDLKTRRRCGR